MLDQTEYVQYIAYMGIKTEDVLKVMSPQMGLFGLLFAFMNRLQAAGDAFYEEITVKQFFLLACLNLYPDQAPTANEMSETMGCSRQNVKEILNSLVKKGIVVLIQDDNDHRKQRIYPTEKMKVISEKYGPKEKEFMELLFKGITDEEAAETFRIISRMENNIKKKEEKK